MWQLIFTSRAKKDLFSLEKLIVQRIVSKLEETKQKPGEKYAKLTGFPYYKLRIGDYRVIAVLDFQRKIIEIRRIGHRKNIYKKM